MNMTKFLINLKKYTNQNVSRVKWFEEGEKNTKYFMSLDREEKSRQKHNYVITKQER